MGYGRKATVCAKSRERKKQLEVTGKGKNKEKNNEKMSRVSEREVDSRHCPY